MSVTLESWNLIIPIHTLKKKCARTIGNVELFLREAVESGSGCSHDEHLYRESAMNPLDVELRLAEWERRGLRLTRKISQILHWNDICVVDTFSGPTLPCSWLHWDLEKQFAWLAGTPQPAAHRAETIIFFHGKESTPETSSSARAVREYFSQDLVLVPDYKPLERSHAEIEQYLSDYLKQAGQDVTLVGISLGGYWAYRMACLETNVTRCVMLNPSFRCYPEVPVLSARTDLPITVIVNVDDDIVDPADAIRRFTGRGAVVTFKKGGHRFENRTEMLCEIEKAMNFQSN